ncbi:putative oxidoreductase [Ancylomarina subtilis]|uniref:Putative oxidoreductase n=1 Tax=Ancylomarina subtilis TaxID=1639035 RepID=A0A4Q7VIH4_9BACT|nr:aldo/keto reductase [Ancylomarina subtilis]RZT95950.1 putative oxidoreductase [Ancylomarina subtilis]
MKRIQLTDNLELSRIIQGHWRLANWELSSRELLKLTEQCLELGVTSFDHADIYGNYTCESLFGDALALKPSLRQNMEIISKCGIKLMSDKYPERKLKTYDYSYKHIVNSVENSLRNLRTDYLDVLLLHRPSPFFNPEEVAKAFSDLKREGKVQHFGVSNFSTRQFDMLNSYTEEKLVTNQVEISPYCLDHFENGNMDFFLKERIKPIAWSPLAGGRLLDPQTETGKAIFKVLSEIAEELNLEQIDQVIYAWLLKHPAGIMPIVGTSRIERVKSAVDALNIDLSHEQWFRIYASTGAIMP